MKKDLKNNLKSGNGYIFVAYHKPFKMLDEDFIVPMHAGRACLEEKKDGQLKEEDINWLMEKTYSDDINDNISIRNNEFSECSVLYWIWKNLNIEDYKYIGFFQYRRQLILNDFYDKAENNFEKKAYKCVHFKNIEKNFCKSIGLTEDKIMEILSEYDCILPYASDLSAMKVSSPYEDWVRKIPGMHVNDLVELEILMQEMHPEMYNAFNEYLNSPKKLMYQIFIAKPEIIKNYCDWMFEILFEMDNRIDTSMYSINGKRTLGYIAEILYGFYFTYMNGDIKIKEEGVSFID